MKFSVQVNNYIYIFAISAIIIYNTILFRIIKDSKCIPISLFLFFAGGFFFQSLNIMRQYIAISIIFFSYDYLLSKKYIKWALCSIVAFLFHSSSLVCLVMLFMIKKVRIKPIMIIIFALVSIIFKEQLYAVFVNVISLTRFTSYLESTFATGSMRWLYFIVNLLLYIYMYMIYITKGYDDDKKANFYINIQGLAVLFVISSALFEIFFRLIFFFSIFTTLSIPYFTENVNFKNIFRILEKTNFLKSKSKDLIKKIEKKCNTKTIKIVLYTIIILGFTANISYTNLLKNEEEVSPYKTIFNIKK